MWVEGGSHVTITNCSSQGLWADVSDSTISWCTVKGGGIRLGDRCVIDNCSVTGGTDGLILRGDGCLVTHCNVTGNSVAFMVFGDRSTLFHSEFDGIVSVRGRENLFYFNNFGYIYNFDLINENSWDNGTYGNYWQLYTGVDGDGDGIGDTPFRMDTNNVDNYPLVIHVDLQYPSASAGPDVVVSQHTLVQLSASGSSDNEGIFRYMWSFHYRGERVNLTGRDVGFVFDDMGEFDVRLVVEDRSFNRDWDMVTVTVLDGDPPELLEDLSPSRVDTGGMLEFNISMRDNVAVSKVWIIWRQGTSKDVELELVRFGNGSFRSSIEVSAYSLDYITYEVHANDSRDNGFHSNTRFVTVFDTIAPTIIETGWSEAKTGDTWDLWLLCEDNIGVTNTKVEYIYEGETYHFLNMTHINISRFEGSMIIPLDRSGNLTFRFWVHDGADLFSFSDWFTLSVLDTIPPYLIEDASDTQATTGDAFNIRALLGDNVGIKEAWCEWRTSRGSGILGLTSSDGVYTGILDIPSSNTEDIEYRIGAFDIAGLIQVTEWIAVGVKDNDPPTVSLDNPPQEHERGTPLSIGVIAMDNIKVLTVKIIVGVDGPSLDATRGSDDQWTATVPGDLLYNSTTTIQVVAIDSEGLEAWSQVLSLDLVDTTPPSSSYDIDPDIPTTGDRLTIGGLATDVSGISSVTLEYSYGNASIISSKVETDQNGHFSLGLDIPFNATGNLALRLLVMDGSGNLQDSGWRDWLIIDNDAPQVMVPKNMDARAGKTVVIKDAGSTDNLGVVNWTWSWSAGGKAHVAYGSSVMLEFDREGDYQVTLTVTDAAGNTDTATMQVVVSDVGSLVSSAMVVVLVLACIVALVVAYVVIRRRMGGQG